MSKNKKRFAPIMERLIVELRANALDFENPPTEKIGDDPHPMNWVPENDGSDETNKTGQNSVYLLNAIKTWEMELPAMSIVVHGGSQHPLMLIQDRGLREQREDFLKSRPRVTDDYFDGQRDPVGGWMSAVNAWRYPAFYVGPNYVMPEFTFKPPHTLFIDASLQAQDDSDLIGENDRVNHEWIMDAVTHQPLGKQAAMKGTDGVFYWDLNVKSAVTPSGVMPPQTQFVGNMRASYDDWYRGMEQQWATVKENNPNMEERLGPLGLLQSRSKFLVGETSPKNIKNWSRITSFMLMNEDLRLVRKEEAAAARAAEEERQQLEPGEVRARPTLRRNPNPNAGRSSTGRGARARRDQGGLNRRPTPGRKPHLDPWPQPSP